MKKFGTRVMFIFPHPDDEAFASGGLIYDLARSGAEVNVLCATKGEASTLKYHGTDEELESVREKEFIEVMKYLGVSNYTILDLGDGKLEENPDVSTTIANQIEKFQPTDVITYEPCGIYGHPDHIYLTQVIEELALQSSWKLVYATVSKKFKPSANALKMAKDPEAVKPIEPNFVYSLALKTYFRKLQSLKLYKSQISASADIGQTLKFLYHMKNEYYHFMKKKRTASRGIVTHDGQVLLIHRIKNGQEYYSIPGGKVEEGETNEQTVEREILEETTMAIKVKEQLGFFEDTNKCSYIFVCEYISGEPSLVNAPEKEEMERNPNNFYEPLWVPLEEALELTIQPNSAAHAFKEYLRKEMTKT